jgi:tRNA pseudouridine32 synthase / 23S rRNA pseudouridine746 synthase
MNNVFDIVEDHSDFVVIYKKPGVSFHSEDGSPGLFETVRQGLGASELFPVHRLDKVTSGLLVMAKNAAANQALVEQFRDRQVEKFYLAISAKKPKKKQGLVRGDMAAARRGAWKLLPSQDNPAITQFMSASIRPGKRLFIVKPHTGKTHQIRVALKSLGAPILGDQLYADAASCELVDRVYLHAYSIGFHLRGSTYRFTQAPREGQDFLSADFDNCLATYSSPWELPWPILK